MDERDSQIIFKKRGGIEMHVFFGWTKRASWLIVGFKYIDRTRRNMSSQLRIKFEKEAREKLDWRRLFWRCVEIEKGNVAIMHRVGQHPYFSMPFAIEDSFPYSVAVYIYLFGFEFVLFSSFFFSFFFFLFFFHTYTRLKKNGKKERKKK